MTIDAPNHAAGSTAPADATADHQPRRLIEVPLALTPLSEGDVHLHVSPITSLAQLDALTATLRSFRQVDAVTVGAVTGETVQVEVRLREPLAFAGHLRGRLGDAVLSVTAARDHLVVALDPNRSWIVDASTIDQPHQAPAKGRAPTRVVAPLVPAERARRNEAPRGPVRPAPRPETVRVTDTRATSRAADAPGPPPTRAPLPRMAPPSVPAATPASRVEPRRRHDLAADVLARNVLDAIPDTSVMVLDQSLHFRAVAGTALKRHGHAREALLGRPAREALSIVPWDLLEPACQAALQGDASAHEFETLDHAAVFEATVSPVRDAANGTGIVLVLRDVTSRRRDAAVIADGDEMFELSFARAPIGKAIVAPDGRFLKVNAALCRLLGHAEDDLLAGDFRQISHADDLDTDEALLRECLDGRRDGYAIEKRYVHAEGHTIHTQLSVAIVREVDGTPRWFVSQVVDISRHRQLEEELRDGAEQDALTGLWNRSRLEVELGLRAQESSRYGVGASLLSIDLDGFAHVNEILGRKRGDAFLRTVAGAIRSTVRDCDHCAHIDRDEFVVLLPHTPTAGAQIVAERIAAALVRCDAPGLDPGFLRASIGVAEIVPGMTAERWLRYAVEAQRTAKRAGGGRSVLGTGPDADVVLDDALGLSMGDEA
jgi:diguanylate cyclase (GGDEF)-like protein/PAS domain S-box-containing protein